MKNKILLLAFILVCQTAFSQSWDHNFIRVRTPQTGINTISRLEAMSANKDSIATEIQYFDGLGRPMQNVGVSASPLGNDMITPIKYDPFGREVKKYLPYITSGTAGSYRSNDESDQTIFYSSSNPFPNCATDGRPFNESILEASPLNRPLQQYGPGQDWFDNHHSTNIAYLTNAASDVPLWTISGNTVSYSGNYTTGTLYKTQTTDENGNNSWEYKDLLDHVVLKQVANNGVLLNTYYVYNDLCQLTYVIPPKATANTYTEGNTDFNELLYAYKYDKRGRVSEKHIPGAGWTYMVYNNTDQVILSQDANHSNTQWLFTKYDALGRVVMTGTFNIGGTRNDVQVAADGNTTFWETRYALGTMGYTDAAYPQATDGTGREILTVNYYDDYSFDQSLPYTNFYGITQSSMTKGLLTGSKVKVLDMGTWLTSVMYYDDKARVIQFQRQLYDDSNGGKEISSSLHDFSGKVLQDKQSQTFNGNTTTVEQWNTYDHMARLTKTEQEVNGPTHHTTTAQLAYNELGQLVNKNVGTIESTDYLYNIRGWLSKVNDPDNLGSKLFAMKLLYNDDPITGLGNTQQYNGNISGLIWNSTGKGEQGYVYSYDPLNRLTNSDYQIYSGGWTQSAAFEERNLTYDLNGNITHLERSDISGDPIANYTYNYDASNKLQNINSGTNYTYDANGNTTTDGLRSMAISYNMLNLPQTISKNGESISYIYTATGEKVAKRMKDNSYQYYAGSFIYNNDKTLNYLLFSEGRVVNSSGAFSYEYQLKDHLGDTRVAFSSSHSVLQVSDYYAFGSSFAPHSPNNDNKYLYNGKELQDDNLSGTNLDTYDYGARFYDPQIGRWHNVDLLSEKDRRWSPFNYGFDNPIRFEDPDGMSPQPPHVGADGLTNDQWIESSNPGADPDLADNYRQQNNDMGNEENNEKEQNNVMEDNPKKNEQIKPNGSEIRQYQPNTFGKIENYLNSFSNTPQEAAAKSILKIGYKIIDDAVVYATSIFLGPNKSMHLNRDGVIGNEIEDAGFNTITNFVPIGSIGKFSGIEKNTLNISEFGSKFKGSEILKGAAVDRGINCKLYNLPIEVNNSFVKQYNAFNYGIMFAPTQQIFTTTQPK